MLFPLLYSQYYTCMMIIHFNLLNFATIQKMTPSPSLPHPFNKQWGGMKGHYRLVPIQHAGDNFMF